MRIAKSFADRAAFNEGFLAEVDALRPDLIVLAGFLVVIPPAMIERYRNRIVNIHPSLIPSFCGTGYYGLKVHEAVLERGVKVTGATVHFVDEGTDTGPIILQKPVEVQSGGYPEEPAEASDGRGGMADPSPSDPTDHGRKNIGGRWKSKDKRVRTEEGGPR